MPRVSTGRASIAAGAVSGGGYDLTLSSAGARPRRPLFRVGFRAGARPGALPSFGVGVGISEGKPLEVSIWSASGAVVGSLAGPAGALIGAGVGALGGLLVSVFVVPHDGPSVRAASAGSAPKIYSSR